MSNKLIIPSGYPYAGCELDELISKVDIQNRISTISCKISREYKGKIPVIIGVLNGAFMFVSDLVKNIDIEFEIDFIKIESYGSNTKSSGTVRLLKDISANITGRDVIVVEDIVDTGLSLKFLKNRMLEASPNSLKFLSLLAKPDLHKKNINVDWIGFNIKDEYVVGYGLDLKQIFRGLPSIYKINTESEKH